MPHNLERRLEIDVEGPESRAERPRRVKDVRSTVREDTQARMAIVFLQGVASEVQTIRDRLAAIPGVRIMRDFLTPLDPSDEYSDRKAPLLGGTNKYPDREALLRIDPYEMSRQEMGTGEPVVVAIVDSGIMVEHQEFKGHLWTNRVDGREIHGACCMGGMLGYDLTDQDGHGTMLAGSILATANFVAGLELMAVKFFDVMVQPAAANAARAIRFAVDNGARIINLSFDLGLGSIELEEAVAYAGHRGALVVMAAGNTGSDNDQYPLVPARYAESCRDSAIVVMATDRYDERAAISNFGCTTVDLAAPGVKVMSTHASLAGTAVGGYGRYTGTSAAAAQVSGAAALLKSKYPKSSARDLKLRLMGTVDLLPRLTCVSGGRLNLGRALTQAQMISPGALPGACAR